MLRLISATLEIGRAEAGMGRQQFAEFDIGELIRDICEIYQPVAEERDMTISVEGTERLRYFGDRQLIGRAVANLADNALKYASDGGTICLGAADQGNRIDLTVSDRGSGIPPEYREDAIRKYRRLEEARTTEGSGLGLAMVRAVARLHGGDIVLEDNAPGLKVHLVLRRDFANA
jgi:signal transduction histidine kinase